jgi:hypothetical protein
MSVDPSEVPGGLAVRPLKGASCHRKMHLAILSRRAT